MLKSNRIKARAALAKTNTTTMVIEGDYEPDRQKFLALSQSFEIEYDNNNNVSSNNTIDRISTNETNISNNTSSINDINNTISILSNKIDAIASIFNIVFNDDGTLNTEEYSSHTHQYTDTQIDEDNTYIDDDENLIISTKTNTVDTNGVS